VPHARRHITFLIMLVFVLHSIVQYRIYQYSTVQGMALHCLMLAGVSSSLLRWLHSTLQYSTVHSSVLRHACRHIFCLTIMYRSFSTLRKYVSGHSGPDIIMLARVQLSTVLRVGVCRHKI
jgi:hypothetical protein